ncbi:hypothetical protein HYW55_00945 [Candidatus Gottesmanbacteria bacterium]|nr:hypothetical protein [Candidatus Gottesmanbacteria bacterium]
MPQKKKTQESSWLTLGLVVIIAMAILIVFATATVVMTQQSTPTSTRTAKPDKTLAFLLTSIPETRRALPTTTSQLRDLAEEVWKNPNPKDNVQGFTIKKNGEARVTGLGPLYNKSSKDVIIKWDYLVALAQFNGPCSKYPITFTDDPQIFLATTANDDGFIIGVKSERDVNIAVAAACWMQRIIPDLKSVNTERAVQVMRNSIGVGTYQYCMLTRTPYEDCVKLVVQLAGAGFQQTPDGYKLMLPTLYTMGVRGLWLELKP